MSHFSSKPCSESNCCCGGSLTVTECGIEWEVTQETYAFRIRRVSTGTFMVWDTTPKRGYIQLDESDDYELELQCTEGNEWVRADSETFVLGLDCCSTDDLETPTCGTIVQENPDSPPFTVIIENATGAFEWVNGTYLLDQFVFFTTGIFSGVTPMLFAANPNWTGGNFGSGSGCDVYFGQNWRCPGSWIWSCPDWDAGCEMDWHINTATGGLVMYTLELQYMLSSHPARRCKLYRIARVRGMQFGRVDGVCYAGQVLISLAEQKDFEEIPCTTDPWYIDASNALANVQQNYPPEQCRF